MIIGKTRTNQPVEGDILGPLENIVDSNGNNRFQSGNLELEEITGVTFTYAKWCITGYDLKIVLAGEIEANSSIPDNAKLAYVPLPDWIKDKIYPVFDPTVVLQEQPFYTAAHNATLKNIALWKDVSGISITNNTGTYTPTAKQYFRIAFSLVIE